MRTRVLISNGVLEEWTQFGRPSGLLITADDTIYVADVQDKPGINFGSTRDAWCAA